MDLTKVQIKQLESKSNWLNWKGRVSILLRGSDAIDVVEGRLKGQLNQMLMQIQLQ